MEDWNCLDLSRAKTRPKVSYEGMPAGNSRNCRSQVSLELANFSMLLFTVKSTPAFIYDAIALPCSYGRGCRGEWPVVERRSHGYTLQANPKKQMLKTRLRKK